jgi:DNA-binding beta-propeller fold protein YncE
MKTIDLATWQGTPVSTVQPPIPVPSNVIVAPTYVQVPQPAPGSAFSLTSIAVDPVSNTIYVADHASSNVYLIDGATNTVSSAAYTYPLSGNIDGVPPALSGTAGIVVTTVAVNPVTNRWLFMGEYGGGQFSGTTFIEAVAGQAMQSGSAWDPVTGNVYGATGDALWVTQGVKWLNFSLSSCNAPALNPMTLRVYTSCILGYTGSGLAQIPNYGIVGVDGGSPNMQARIGRGTPYPASWYTLQNANAQPAGLAVNANTNRLYVAAATSPTSLDVIDLSTNAMVASIPGLPDQSPDFLIGGIYPLPLPRPIAINTLTNTIFVVNSVSSTISVFDGNTNALTGTIAIPVPDGAIVNVPVPASTIMQDIKPGNTFFNNAGTPTSLGTLTSLGGAIAIAVNESTNTLYVASVNGTISVFALNPPTAPAAFSVNGVIQNAQGVPASGVTVRATGPGGNATAVTDAMGLFVLTGLPTGTYTITPMSASFSFGPASQSVTVNGANIRGLTFQANPPIVPNSYTLSPWTMIGAGVTTTATVTLNQPAPVGGAVLTLSASDPKAAKVPSTVTVPAGQSSVSFPVQGSGVSATTTVTLNATYNGGTAGTSLTVAPGDKVTITKATYSTSTHLLTVTATDTNSQATLNVFLASNNQLLGTMVTQGSGSYALQVVFPSGTPSSVNAVSNLGAKTGQGVTVTP